MTYLKNVFKMTKKIFLIILVGILAYGCEKEAMTSNSELLTITTSSAVYISSSSATCGGSIVNNSNDIITAYGICWAITPSPTIDNAHSAQTDTMSTFTHAIQGLEKNQTYYVRAYATNSVGINYGNQISFTTDTTEHVYISGISDGRSVYWKDGVLNALTASGTFNFALGNSIAVSNNNVYVAGYELFDTNTYKATIWKNGIGTALTNVQSFAKAIAVVNDDVYIVGTENYVAKIWKNGVSTVLSATGKPTSIMVYNNNVYVGGSEGNAGNSAGTIWTNGTPTRLYGFCFPGACTFDNTIINDIFVVDNDVYAVGTSISDSGIEDNIIWKNGIATQIAIKPSSIFIKNNEMYIAGTVGNTASIWKNGTITSLTDGSNQAFANSVYVLGDDVYVTGSERIPGTSNTTAKFWKNGSAFNFSNGSSSAEATDIFVQ